MLVREFDFDLPAELIAQQPAAERGASRLLHLDRSGDRLSHRTIADLPALLAGALLVVNNTRVFPARLLGRRVPSGGAVECLLVRREAAAAQSANERGEWWEALMHPGQRLRPGQMVQFDGAHTLHGEVRERRFHGRRLIRLWTDDGTAVEQVVDEIGHMPLPPYIKRDDDVADRDRYQTVFATARGSVAAPTAGLHLHHALIGDLIRHGVDIVEITLHVGYGTFQPVRVERVEDHRIEPERYEVGESAAAAVNAALEQGRRVVAVGTTTTRTLEAIGASHGGRVVAGAGATDLFIHPGFPFRIVGGLLTNFHLPQSSLLMLVAAFAGHERIMRAYSAAIAERYRFYSYGDAMVIL